MFTKYVEVEFIGAASAPQDVYSAYFYHNRYEHQLVTISFRDWGIYHDTIEPGTPVVIHYGFTNKQTFYGYVHHLSSDRSVNNNFMEITFIGASFLMKQQSQKVYLNKTADQIVQEIAEKHGLSHYTVPHERVWPQLSQSGESDWSFLVKLAKKCGYTLRVHNTELYFQPMLEDFTNQRLTAPNFVLRGPINSDGWSMYSFKPLIGESIPYEDALKGAVAVSGMDYVNNEPIKNVQQTRNKKTRKLAKPEIFDVFATSVVVTDQETARHEAKAAEDRNVFPYRAEAVLMGDPTIRPDMPIFLDGLGEPYTGYWTVLKVTHSFEEKTRGTHLFTTTVVVGTDSLGDADTWVDGTVVSQPVKSGVRVVTPTVKKTQKKSVSSLTGDSFKVPRQSRGAFTVTETRDAPKSAFQSKPAAWKSNMKTLVEPDKSPSRPYHVVSRLKKAGRI